MIIVGVSGLIASGKTSFSNNLSKLGFPVFDADQVVHRAFATPTVISYIKDNIGEVVFDGVIDRKKLSDLAFSDKKILSLLESYLHPIVRQEMHDFIRYHFCIKTKVVILDIPLLYESNICNICDYTILVRCSLSAQKYRYLKRKNSSLEKLQKILNIQQKNILKEKKADIVFDTTLSKIRNLSVIKNIIKEITGYERNNCRYRNYRFKSRRWRPSY